MKRDPGRGRGILAGGEGSWQVKRDPTVSACRGEERVRVEKVLGSCSSCRGDAEVMRSQSFRQRGDRA